MVRTNVSNYIIENFLYGESGNFSDDDSLLDKGIIDSTGILELVTFIETEYKFKVDDMEINRENFDSVNKLVKFIENKTKTVVADMD